MIMKKSIFLLIVILYIFACKHEEQFYDIDGPIFEFYTYINEDILFQYNEPVSNINFILKEKNKTFNYKIENIFPVANIRIPCDFFKKNETNELIIKATDTSSNCSFQYLFPPVINNNPIQLQINEIGIKYTKKRKQKIVLKALTSGDVSGYKLILFIRNKKVSIPFLNENIKSGKELEIIIDSSKENYQTDYKLSFKSKSVNLIFRYRLSQIYSLIYIIDSKNNILDYFYYYNLKKHSIDYYNENKNFNKLKSELLYYNINSILFDISKTTSIKTVIKKANKFIIKK